MRIVLIGNGSSVLERPLGEEINQFDRVVRFNSYKINGYEQFVGTKTTDWFNVQLLDDNDFRLNCPYEKYVFHSWKWGDVGDKILKMNSLVQSNEKIYTNKSIIEEMSAVCRDEYKWFSTGAIAVWMLLRDFEQVYLYGFDWWRLDAHHYGDNQIRGTLHDPQKELSFFKKLNEKIIFL